MRQLLHIRRSTNTICIFEHFFFFRKCIWKSKVFSFIKSHFNVIRRFYLALLLLSVLIDWFFFEFLSFYHTHIVPLAIKHSLCKDFAGFMASQVEGDLIVIGFKRLVKESFNFSIFSLQVRVGSKARNVLNLKLFTNFINSVKKVTSILALKNIVLKVQSSLV